MEMEDNIVEFTGEWHGSSEELPEGEYASAMEELLGTVEQEHLGRIVAGVLEFLTVRAIIDGPFYLMTDDERAITVFAAEDDAVALRDALPNNFKAWNEDEEQDFLTNHDPGDEQDEPATESE